MRMPERPTLLRVFSAGAIASLLTAGVAAPSSAIVGGTPSGFGTIYPTVAYTWSVNVIGPSYNYTHNWHGVLAGNYTFDMRSTVRAVTYRGMYSAKASGSTTHLNGAICKSLGPIANITL